MRISGMELVSINAAIHVVNFVVGTRFKHHRVASCLVYFKSKCLADAWWGPFWLTSVVDTRV